MPENTTDRDPMVHTLGAMSEGSSGYIEGMEAAGQRQLVESTAFPTRAPIEDLLALGFRFGPVDESDPLFRPAQLPEGWTKEASDHAMQSYVLDDKGRRRVLIFYKAAFYDRRASATLMPPTAILADLIYDTAAPLTLELDDLLTENIARGYLARRRTDSAEQLENSSAQMRNYYRDELARIEQLLALLPPVAADA